MIYYYCVCSFMHEELDLSGITESVFAYIFARWMANHCLPKAISLNEISKAIGVDKSSVARSLATIETKGYIQRQRVSGQRTQLSVTICEEIFKDYIFLFRRKSLSEPSSVNLQHPPVPSCNRPGVNLQHHILKL